jgi:hypothetical protein
MEGPANGDARIAQMKEGRTHWAHKAEHRDDVLGTPQGLAYKMHD